jgi:hypothetical protein
MALDTPPVEENKGLMLYTRSTPETQTPHKDLKQGHIASSRTLPNRFQTTAHIPGISGRRKWDMSLFQ